jgi:N-acetylneuraminate synthase
MNTIQVGRHTIGPGCRCFVIAEAGVNHNGDRSLALELVAAAAESGADAVKFQTFRADRLVTRSAPKAGYQRQTTAAGELQYDMLRPLELGPEVHLALIERCRQLGITFLSTAFDEESADLLESFDLPAFKIPSGEITNIPYLEHVAAKKRPILLSTGMSTLDEVQTAVETIRRAGQPDLALLHCVSSYPTPFQDVNLRAMQTMASVFDVPVGYSDHTLGVEAALAAVALGACIIEKHLTTDRTLGGPDHRASIEPADLRALVAGIRRVEASLGDGRKVPTSEERITATVVRRSLVAARGLSAGTVLQPEQIQRLRPGSGLPPSMLPAIIGRRLLVDVEAGDQIHLEMLA